MENDFNSNKFQKIKHGMYNQDLSDRAILIEVGGVNNNKEEQINAVDACADAFTTFNNY